MNLAALHDWLRREHGYEGSLQSVQRYWRRAYPAPAIRARRRVETPAGAQAQVDWADFPGACSGRRGGGPRCADHDAVVEPAAGGRLGAVEGHAVVAGLPDRLLPAAGRRAGGSADGQREDGDGRGAGAWGMINATYRRYAVQLAFHVDACQPRQPQGKGKVERRVRDLREAIDPAARLRQTSRSCRP